MLQFGFVPSKCDPSLFVYSSSTALVYMLIYVDDIILTGSDSAFIQQVVTKLNSVFSLKELGDLEYFLGIEVKPQSNGCLLLSQGKYIRDLLSKTNMLDSKPLSTPMFAGCKLTKAGSDTFSDPTLYRSVVGALPYATITRPDICFSVNKVCQFMSHPLEAHWQAVKRIMRYLKGTISLGLILHPVPQLPIKLQAFCDADWGFDPDDRCSTSGACVFLGSNLISWWAKKQPVISRSSTEAEYRSLALATSELLWIQSLLTELGVTFTRPLVHCDNMSTISLTHNPVLHACTKHMELDLFFVREKVLNKQLQVVHVPGHLQCADVLTKALPPSKFEDFRTKLTVDNPQMSLRGANRDSIE